MEIKRKSYFKDEKADLAYFENWVTRLEENNGRKYERYEIETSLGKTLVWGLHTKEALPDTLVIFPGARTTSLIWDFDKGLDNLGPKIKIFLVETNGLPNLSNGATPEIKSLDYGHWSSEVFEKLGIERAFVAGASFGGLVCMKMGIVSPEKIKAIFLLNPGCFRFISLTFKNLYFNILPLVSTNRKNVLKFLDKAIFSKPNHQLSEFAEEMFVDYQVFAISRYKDNTQKPSAMGKQIEDVTVDTFLLLGDKDLLFPFQKSIETAKRQVKKLQEIKVFKDVGHGIETYDKAMNYIGDKIRNFRSSGDLTHSN